MTVKEIVTNYLKENGFDGLSNFECGCGIDDLCWCGELKDDCEPAYRHNFAECKKCDNLINCRDGDETDYYCPRKIEVKA